MPHPEDLFRRNALRAFVVVCAVAAAGVSAEPPRNARAHAFPSLVEQLSEAGGDFAGDNLISNEQSYLHVMPALERGQVAGGAFIGIGPDQNFSYIAQIKPAIAYIIDIRRENLLLHLLFKALFAEAPTRVGYLSLLTGRPGPEHPERWADANIDAIIEHVDGVEPLPDEQQQRMQSRLEAVIGGFGIPLSATDRDTIARSRGQFVTAGLSLLFQARGQPRRSYYPSLRTLLRETDRAGRQLSYLANEPGFQFVRTLHARDRIVPVVGDVSGAHAIRAIAADMSARGLQLSALYISNVEYYLFQKRIFAAYADNMKRLPHDERSVVIRSVFPSGGSRSLPQAVPGCYSTSLVQPFAAMLADLEAGRYRTYRDLVLASSRGTTVP